MSTKTQDQHKILESLVSEIKGYTINGNDEKFRDGTIYNMDGAIGCVKLELAVEKSSAYLTRITGDCEGVLEWDRENLIGVDLLSLFNVPKSTINEAFTQLEKNQFYFKVNKIKTQKGKDIIINSILMWREKGRKIVEFIWKPI